MLDIFLDALIDSVKLIPFLLVTYLIMEYIEHKTTNKTKKVIKQSGKLGPVFGGILGIFPQCGFSAAASSLYAGRVITLGTLISIYLSTSDEMLPILISEAVDVKIILRILAIKAFVGILFGFIIDFFINLRIRDNFQEKELKIHDICEHGHCNCDKKILIPAIKHTIQITLFLLIISVVLGMLIKFIGEDNFSSLILNKPIIGQIISGLIGLIPNCASSVIITQLFLEGLLSAGSMISGLLVSAGVGILILFKVNEDTKENIKIVGLLYCISVIVGIIIEIFNIAI